MGADFSNGFTVGGVAQKYNGNSLNEMPTAPIFEKLTMNNKYGIDFKVANQNNASCQAPISYELYGPNGVIGDFDAYYAYASKQHVLGRVSSCSY